MTNAEKYEQIFMEMFGAGKEELQKLVYQSIPEWDSVGHMQLIAALEDEFGIMFETDDIIELDSFEKGKEFLKKYGVEL